MTKRERLLRALRGQKVDRMPLMYRALPSLTRRLMKFFNIGDQNDPFQIIRGHKELFSCLGNIDYSGFGGSMYYTSFAPRFIGNLDNYDYMDTGFCSLFGVKWKEINSQKNRFKYKVISENPWAGFDDPKKIEGLLTKFLDLFDYKNSVNLLLNNGRFSEYTKSNFAKSYLDYSNLIKEDTIISMGVFAANPFMYCSYLRGMDNFMMDMAGNKRMAEAIINEVSEFSIEFNRRSFKQTDISADIFVTWDDVCMQSGLMFSVEMLKKYFMPFWENIISLAKSNNMLFGWHCCGNINEVLPLMIDCGLDMFDVLQTSAKDMDIEIFYKKFGKDVCVQGGIDVQRILTCGTSGQVREEVKKIKNLWGNSGNIILGPSHEALPETPVENIIALYDEANKE